MAGGGTGGHLYPGIAVARELGARRVDAQVTFAGTAAGIEARVVPREGFVLDVIRSGGLKGKSLAARLREAPDRKSALARAGAATVRPGELVFIDTGSTNLALVDFLPEDAGLTVATNGVDVAAAVLHRQDLRLIVIGGEVDPHLGGCVDAAAVESLRDLRIAEVSKLDMKIENGKVVAYRARVTLSFKYEG